MSQRPEEFSPSFPLGRHQALLHEYRDEQWNNSVYARVADVSLAEGIQPECRDLPTPVLFLVPGRTAFHKPLLSK